MNDFTQRATKMRDRTAKAACTPTAAARSTASPERRAGTFPRLFAVPRKPTSPTSAAIWPPCFRLLSETRAGDSEQQAEDGRNERGPRLGAGDQISPDAQEDKDDCEGKDDAGHVHKAFKLAGSELTAKAAG